MPKRKSSTEVPFPVTRPELSAVPDDRTMGAAMALLPSDLKWYLHVRAQHAAGHDGFTLRVVEGAALNLAFRLGAIAIGHANRRLDQLGPGPVGEILASIPTTEGDPQGAERGAARLWALLTGAATEAATA